eukprot:6435299-Prymnesium_polylepis.1
MMMVMMMMMVMLNDDDGDDDDGGDDDDVMMMPPPQVGVSLDTNQHWLPMRDFRLKLSIDPATFTKLPESGADVSA